MSSFKVKSTPPLRTLKSHECGVLKGFRTHLVGSDLKNESLNEKGPSFTLGPSVLVRLAGIEPTTPWFVAKYSIQLSYSRIKTDIMPWKSKTT